MNHEHPLENRIKKEYWIKQDNVYTKNGWYTEQISADQTISNANQM